jgi:hypothetical protein
MSVGAGVVRGGSKKGGNRSQATEDGRYAGGPQSIFAWLKRRIRGRRGIELRAGGFGRRRRCA